jgi:predicted ATP pyrophosphatase (TIGR00289 family)
MHGIEGVCSGALFSNYQRERIEAICESLGIRSFAPLWHMNQIAYLKQLVAAGFDAIITKIAAQGLNEKWLGRKIDADAIRELEALEKKIRVNPAGEGGEYETLMLDALLFKKKLAVEFDKKMQNDFTGEINIKKAKLIEK